MNMKITTPLLGEGGFKDKNRGRHQSTTPKEGSLKNLLEKVIFIIQSILRVMC